MILVAASGCSRKESHESESAAILEKIRHGDFETALADVNKALPKYANSDLSWAWRFRIQKAYILIYRGSYADALRLLAEEPPPALAHSPVAVRRRLIQGIARDSIQQFDEADKDLAAAAEMARAFQPDLIAEVAQARGTLETHRRRYAEAIAAFQSVLAAARKRNQPYQETNALGSLGNVAMMQEHYDEAIDWFKSALQKSQTLNALASTALTLGNLGWNYSALGDFESAESMFKEAERASARAGLVGNRVYWLVTLGDVYYQQRRYAEAEAISLQALPLAQGMDDKAALAQCLIVLSEIALSSQRLDAAEKYNHEVSEVEKLATDHSVVLSSLLLTARIEAAKHHVPQAVKLFSKLISDSSGETSVRWAAHARLAQLLERSRPLEAERQFRSAIYSIDDARRSVHSIELRLSFLTSAIEFYDAYIDFLITRHRPDDALHVAELSRTQTLTEGLHELPRRLTPTSARLQPQRLAARFQSTLLFYWIGQENSHLWVITPAKTTYFKLPPASVVDPVVADYRKALLRMHDAQDEGSAEGKKLYAMLVEPAKKLIPRGSRVVVLPAESLYGLNFETLIVPGPQPHFWIEDVTLTTGSSLTMLAASGAQAPPKDKSLFLVGDTKPPNPPFAPLPQAAEEMKQVKKYFPRAQTRVLEGGSATPSAFLQSNPEQFSYLHFVTHGTASHTRPLESAVILSQEGDSYKLYARDIVQHRLNANLVTISACNGAGTRAYSGEGLVGLSWAFLRAGAHNVIGALWEVSDASTPQLMDAFYRELFQGKDPSTALRDAKLGLLHSADPDSVFKKPFYWAPFQLYAGS
jgi:CHAT domain-containing protein